MNDLSCLPQWMIYGSAGQGTKKGRRPPVMGGRRSGSRGQEQHDQEKRDAEKNQTDHQADDQLGGGGHY